MNGIVITGGRYPDFSHVRTLFNSDALVAAADSGADACLTYGITPTYLIGDFDSLKNRRLLDTHPRDRIVQLNRHKDDTDTEAAIELLSRKGCRSVTLVGGGGGSLSHLLALYDLFDSPGPLREWYTHGDYIRLIEREYRGVRPAGSRISFFPVGTGAVTMESRGLQWPLDQLVWQKGDHGVSNCVTEGNFSVKVKTGRLVMIYSLSQERE